MTASCAYWKDAGTLDQAQENKRTDVRGKCDNSWFRTTVTRAASEERELVH
jgi:hypothetical protein